MSIQAEQENTALEEPQLEDGYQFEMNSDSDSDEEDGGRKTELQKRIAVAKQRNIEIEQLLRRLHKIEPEVKNQYRLVEQSRKKLIKIMKKLRSCSMDPHPDPESCIVAGVHKFYHYYYRGKRIPTDYEDLFTPLPHLLPYDFKRNYINKLSSVLPDFISWKQNLDQDLNHVLKNTSSFFKKSSSFQNEPYLTFRKITTVLSRFELDFINEQLPNYVVLSKLIETISQKNPNLLCIFLYFFLGRLGPNYKQRKSPENPINLQGYGSIENRTLLSAISQATWVPEEYLRRAIRDRKVDNLASLARSIFIAYTGKNEIISKRKQEYLQKERKEVIDFLDALKKNKSELLRKRKLEFETNFIEQSESQVNQSSGIDFWDQESNDDYTRFNELPLSFSEVLLAICAIKFNVREEREIERILVYIMRRANNPDQIYEFLRFFVEVEEEDEAREKALFMGMAHFLITSKSPHKLNHAQLRELRVKKKEKQKQRDLETPFIDAIMKEEREQQDEEELVENEINREDEEEEEGEAANQKRKNQQFLKMVEALQIENIPSLIEEDVDPNLIEAVLKKKAAHRAEQFKKDQNELEKQVYPKKKSKKQPSKKEEKKEAEKEEKKIENLEVFTGNKVIALPAELNSFQNLAYKLKQIYSYRCCLFKMLEMEIAEIGIPLSLTQPYLAPLEGCKVGYVAMMLARKEKVFIETPCFKKTESKCQMYKRVQIHRINQHDQWRVLIYDQNQTEIGDTLGNLRLLLEEGCENGSFCKDSYSFILDCLLLIELIQDSRDSQLCILDLIEFNHESIFNQGYEKRANLIHSKFNNSYPYFVKKYRQILHISDLQLYFQEMRGNLDFRTGNLVKLDLQVQSDQLTVSVRRAAGLYSPSSNQPHNWLLFQENEVHAFYSKLKLQLVPIALKEKEKGVIEILLCSRASGSQISKLETVSQIMLPSADSLLSAEILEKPNVRCSVSNAHLTKYKGHFIDPNYIWRLGAIRCVVKTHKSAFTCGLIHSKKGTYSVPYLEFRAQERFELEMFDFIQITESDTIIAEYEKENQVIKAYLDLN